MAAQHAGAPARCSSRLDRRAPGRWPSNKPLEPTAGMRVDLRIEAFVYPPRLSGSTLGRNNLERGDAGVLLVFPRGSSAHEVGPC